MSCQDALSLSVKIVWNDLCIVWNECKLVTLTLLQVSVMLCTAQTLLGPLYGHMFVEG